jgi:hypothetical protein
MSAGNDGGESESKGTETRLRIGFYCARDPSSRDGVTSTACSRVALRQFVSRLHRLAASFIEQA